MKPLAHIDDTGLHLPGYPEVLERLTARFRAIFGEDVYLEPDSQDGQLLAIFALELYDTYCLAGSVYNAYSPATAQGAGLARMVAINGIRRDRAGTSSADLRCIGQPGTVIRRGVAQDTAGHRWLLPETVSIGLSGEVLVTATAAEQGAIRAAAGEIATIATPTRGWQAVRNPLAAVPGAPVETDADLRQRQYTSTALPSRTVFEGTLGGVAAVSGVSRWRGYENDADVPDANGIPAHHICLVVQGGDAQAIAEAIAVKKTPGTGTHGDIILTARDARGVPTQIRFFRPENCPVRVAVTLAPRPDYVASTGETIRAAISAHINALPIGEDVLHSRLYCPVNEADGLARTFDVVEIRLGLVAGGGLFAGNVRIGYTEAAICYADDVEVILA